MTQEPKEPSGASGGSLANYSAIPDSCLRGSTVEQRFCEPPVAGSTPAAGLYVHWIPVTERLPEERVDVLVSSPCPNSDTPNIDIASWGGEGEQGPVWREADCGRIEPTHWMPLPAPTRRISGGAAVRCIRWFAGESYEKGTSKRRIADMSGEAMKTMDTVTALRTLNYSAEKLADLITGGLDDPRVRLRVREACLRELAWVDKLVAEEVK